MDSETRCFAGQAACTSMQTRQGNVLRSLRAVQQFLNDFADRLSIIVNTGVRQRLTDAIADLAGGFHRAVERRGGGAAPVG